MDYNINRWFVTFIFISTECKMKVENNIITINRKEFAFYICCTMVWSGMIGFLIGF